MEFNSGIVTKNFFRATYAAGASVCNFGLTSLGNVWRAKSQVIVPLGCVVFGFPESHPVSHEGKATRVPPRLLTMGSGVHKYQSGIQPCAEAFSTMGKILS
jgi:hypothetical protein